MSSSETASNTTARTQIVPVKDHSYAYRRFGRGSGLPLLSLQHFTGTLDNWDPAVTDPLASGRELILFDNAGVARSSGEVPPTIAEMLWQGRPGMTAHYSAAQVLELRQALELIHDDSGRVNASLRMLSLEARHAAPNDSPHLEKDARAKKSPFKSLRQKRRA